MPASADIYSMVRPAQQQPGPLDNFSAMLQLRGMIDQGELHGLQRQKLSGDLQEEEAFKSKIADWVKAGGQGTLPAEAYAVSPSRAGAFDKSRGEAQKNQAELLTKDRENLIAFATEDRKVLPTITTPEAWAQYRDAQFKRAGMFVTPEMRQHAMRAVEAMPQQLDPNYIRNATVQADKLFVPEPQEMDLGGKKIVVDKNPFTNPGILRQQFAKTQTPGEVAQQNQPIYDEARGVYVERPARGAPAAGPAMTPVSAPAGGPAAAPAAPGVIKPTGLPPKPTDVHNLRNEFNALPEVKQYKDTLPIVEAARTSPDTRAGDIQLAYAVGKILDPNSVVREGELKMSTDAQTTLAKYWGELTSATTGAGRLSSATRKDLLAMLDNAVTQRETAYKTAETTYRGIAEKNGIPADQVIIKPMQRTKDGAPGAGPKMFDAMPDPAKYNGRRLQADDGTVYTSNGKSWVREKRTVAQQ